VGANSQRHDLGTLAQELAENEARYHSMATAMGRYTDSLRSIDMIAKAKEGKSNRD